MFERRDRRNFRPARQRLRDADPKQRRQRQREALDLEAEIDRRMQQREHAGSSGDRAVDGGLGMAASRFEAMDKNPAEDEPEQQADRHAERQKSFEPIIMPVLPNRMGLDRPV